MIRSLLVSLVIEFVIAGDESCHNECFKLNTGMVNMSCMFSSLPIPASVTWLHKPPNSISWTDFPCSSKDETKQCWFKYMHYFDC
uniref:Ig-like domain-containing protein n=1 Tax=Heterorhabditis bacteriophora TaxID=37862 RepID=A0A1I7WSE2_HETBA